MTAHNDRYGWRHRKLRAAALADAYGTPCVRCGKPMLPSQRLDLDHVDGAGPTEYLGFSHSGCNAAAGAVRGNRSKGREIVMESPAGWIGADTSNDRAVTSVVVARWGTDASGREKILTTLSQFPGPSPVEEILELYGEDGVEVVLDAGGHMRALMEALRPAGVKVRETTAQDRAAATATLKDHLNGGTIRVPGDTALRAAVQHAQERDLVGGSTLDKRRSPVDVSPLVALELATWAATLRKEPVEVWGFYR
jgi:hypothetical protein